MKKRRLRVITLQTKYQLKQGQTVVHKNVS